MNKKIFGIAAFIVAGLLGACDDDFLTTAPKGVVGQQSLESKKGVDALLIGAYSLLDGVGSGNTAWHSAVTNWVYGGVASDDTYKGTDAGDQPEITFIETYNWLPSNNHFRGKWRNVYDGIARSNDVLLVMANAKDMTDAEKAQVTAEARFLRGHYHFEAKKMWNKVPYIDEKTYDPMNPEGAKVANKEDIWPKIEADFKAAYDVLPVNQAQIGRATKYAAAAYLAKAYMFQGKYAEAKPLLDEIIASGRYKLEPTYYSNYNAATNNNAESIFEVQMSVNDGSPGGVNGNNGNILNYPYTGPWNCCGFEQPSQNLVNAFKTEGGLPLLDTFNQTDVKNDEGLDATAPFTPYDGPLDPRLDHTVGRRGIPYLDFGIHTGKPWVRDQVYAGPYSPKKMIPMKGFYHATNRNNSNNYRMIRLAHVILWRAEVAVAEGDLEKARELVNQVRSRAANPDGFVKMSDGSPAANYVINTYNTPFASKEEALKAVQFETRLEFGMEGHRFFDLVRWGIADEVLNTYVAKEQQKRIYLKGATFTKGKNDYFPIPQQEIINSTVAGENTLAQNPGY
ncbi:RagB/SusD family nutrient uptake outer membrane protein [Pontibacter sp. E15-1]|uniref:RagB/SusD family nutrient uptake outer membrane protein n=1 Tax=Pontibacter sp. E15-1 TaxID=2919918 RepID=UPI00397BC6BD